MSVCSPSTISEEPGEERKSSGADTSQHIPWTLAKKLQPTTVRMSYGWSVYWLATPYREKTSCRPALSANLTTFSLCPADTVAVRVTMS
jgi:hypothetical protein